MACMTSMTSLVWPSSFLCASISLNTSVSVSYESTRQRPHLVLQGALHHQAGAGVCVCALISNGIPSYILLEELTISPHFSQSHMLMTITAKSYLELLKME